MFRNDIQDYIQPYRDKGYKVWSISRINNFNQCRRGYYFTYIDKKDQKPSVYATLGTICHESLEEVYEGKRDTLDKTGFDNQFEMCELFGITFPKSKYDIRGNYKKDIDMFYKYFKKEEGHYISELGFVLEIDDENIMMGFIDLLEILPDGSVKITDFKTSASFDKPEKLQHSGRQLCIYQLALEQLYGLKVVSNKWLMLKYFDITVGDIVKKNIQGNKLIKNIESPLKKLFKKLGYDAFSTDLYIAQAYGSGIDVLPQDIRDNIKIEVHPEYYDVTDEIKAETMEYIKNTIKDIENEKDWECKADKFFCTNLCGFNPKHCTGE